MTALRYYWIGGILWWITPVILPLWLGSGIPLCLLAEGDVNGALTWFVIPPVPIGFLCWLHDRRFLRELQAICPHDWMSVTHRVALQPNVRTCRSCLKTQRTATRWSKR